MFDPPGPTFRHEQFVAYKANRPDAPKELHQNLERVKQVMRAFGVPIYEVAGYEADDVLGTIAAYATENAIDCIIVTGDTDTLQLVSPQVGVLLTTGFGDTKLYDEAAVRERYGGLEPDQQRDVKALTGDTSDNIPGVPGIGAKTAVKLIQEFHRTEELLERVDEVKPPRIQGLIPRARGDDRAEQASRDHRAGRAVRVQHGGGRVWRLPARGRARRVPGARVQQPGRAHSPRTRRAGAVPAPRTSPLRAPTSG